MGFVFNLCDVRKTPKPSTLLYASLVLITNYDVILITLKAFVPVYLQFATFAMPTPSFTVRW